jgi:hypothetical protein
MSKSITEVQHHECATERPKTDDCDPEESPFTISTANLVTMGKPIGTFAGSEDFIIRIRNGKLVTADTGDQRGEVKIRK